MGSFGEHLRRERELRGISLDQIVATTKIGRRLLLALEDEQFDLLPGGIFNKSYVRAYAKCVGMNEEEAVTEYLQAAHEAPPDTRVIAQQHASIHSNRPIQRSGFPVLPVLILLVVAAGGIGGWKVYQDHQKLVALSSSARPPDAAAPVAGAAEAPKNATASPAPSSGQRSASENSASQPRAAATGALPAPSSPAPVDNTAPGAPFEVIVRPKDAAWVSIKSDGQFVVRGIIKPPDVRTIHATNQVVFFTGNAGAVEVSFNGKNVPLAGGPNQEQVLVFDSRGVKPGVHSETGSQ